MDVKVLYHIKKKIKTDATVLCRKSPTLRSRGALV